MSISLVFITYQLLTPEIPITHVGVTFPDWHTRSLSEISGESGDVCWVPVRWIVQLKINIFCSCLALLKVFFIPHMCYIHHSTFLTLLSATLSRQSQEDQCHAGSTALSLVTETLGRLAEHTLYTISYTSKAINDKSSHHR